MYQLKKIDIPTVALYSFLMFLILGLIFFLPLGLLISLISSMIPDTGMPEQDFIPFFGGIFIIIIPVFYAIIGMIVNVLIALLYNLLSIKLGGIKINLEKIAAIEEKSN